MTYIHCANENCEYQEDDKCTRDHVCIDDLGECASFTAKPRFEDTGEYKTEYVHEFWKRIRPPQESKNPEHFKKKARGKRIERGNLVLFAESDLSDDFASLTEEKTGMFACYAKAMNDDGLIRRLETRCADFLKSNKPVVELEERTE